MHGAKRSREARWLPAVSGPYVWCDDNVMRAEVGSDVTRPVSARRSIGRIAAFCVPFALVYVLMIRVGLGQQIDTGSFGAVSMLNALFTGSANLFRVAAPMLLTVVGVVLGIWALVRRRFGDALRAVAIVVCSVGLSQVLKDLVLQRPRLGANGYDQNTFPSGHVALALSAAVAIAIVLPASRWRWLALLSVVLAVSMVSWASVVSYAHRPSDVIGGSLLVGAVSSAVFWRRRPAIDAYPAVMTVLLGTAAFGAVLIEVGS